MHQYLQQDEISVCGRGVEAMSIWDVYEDRMNIRGITKRDAQLKREARAINRRLPDSLSYQEVIIHDLEHGYNIPSKGSAPFAAVQNVAVIDSDNLNEKTIISMPGEDITHGALVRWMDNYWLVTERDANTTVYTTAKMIQCNHLLRWVSKEDKIIEQWCIVEDGTKYLTGEYEDRNFIVTRGDSRIAITIARNRETVRLNRYARFLIDDPESPLPLAYALTKPLKLGGSYNNMGVFKFVLQEVVTTDDDNLDYRIADYYKHFTDSSRIPVPPEEGTTGKKRWL